MKATSEFQRAVESVRRLCIADRYAAALRQTSKLMKRWPDNPQLLVLWADLIQLQEDEGGTPTLDDARAALHRAVELDEHSPNPLLELGHFLYAVDDQTPKAVKCYAKAIALSKRLLREALLAQAEALAELDKKEEAMRCLAEAYTLDSRETKPANGKNGEIFERMEALRA